MCAPDFASLFLQESEDLLDRLERILWDLRRAPDSRPSLEEAFRALHTIKGSGAMFGFARAAAVTEAFEAAFDRLRRGAVRPTRELISVTLAAVGHLRMLIARPEDAEPAGDGALLADLARAVEAGDAASSPPARAAETCAAEERVALWRVHYRAPAAAFVAGPDPLVLLDALRALGQCRVAARTEAVPTLEEIEPAACYLAWDVELATSRPRAAIEAVFAGARGRLELEPTPQSPPSRAG